jgi:hypothetical protein
VNGRLAKDSARDFYTFRVEEKPRKLVLEVFSRRVGTPMDPEILLYDAKTGNLIQADDDARGRDCRIERDLGPGEYVVAVRDIDDRGGPEFAYRLSIGPPQPRFRLVPPRMRPRSRAAKPSTLTVKVEREDGFDGEVTIGVENLPAGVTLSGAAARDCQRQERRATDADGNGRGSTWPARIAVVGTGKTSGEPQRALRALARTQETYNIQGTAFQRDLLGPVLFVAEK